METILAPLPLGTSDFSALRKSGQIYVDKTGLIYTLASKRQKFFLSRPRRFGKSLLLSTFESLFKYGLRDFHGLEIEALWKDESTYQVIRLDFSNLKGFSSAEEFSELLDQYLLDTLTVNRLVSPIKTDKEGLRAFIGWLALQADNSVVLLLDEYDTPLTSCLNNPQLFDEVRKKLWRLYGAFKQWDGAIRFFFMTGIAKFSQTSIFSEHNHFTDISLMSEFGSLLGYSHQEVQRYFSGYLEQASLQLGIEKEKLLEELTVNYDGFCFERTATQRVFSPWSLLKFLNFPSNGFDNYWYESGGQPGVLLEYLKSHSTLKPEDYESEKQVQLDDRALSAKFSLLDDKVLLAQTGYLTIKTVRGTTVTLGYPNREVSVSMARLYAEVILDKKAINRAGEGYLADYLEKGDLPAFVKEVNRIILGIDYQAFPLTTEASCRSAVSIMVSSSSALVTARGEVHNALGRSDLEIQTDKNYWVLEFKFCREKESPDFLLQEAVRQIKTRHYGEQLAKCNLLRAALVFSQKDRQFIRWAEVPD